MLTNTVGPHLHVFNAMVVLLAQVSTRLGETNKAKSPVIFSISINR